MRNDFYAAAEIAQVGYDHAREQIKHGSKPALAVQFRTSARLFTSEMRHLSLVPPDRFKSLGQIRWQATRQGSNVIANGNLQ